MGTIADIPEGLAQYVQMMDSGRDTHVLFSLRDQMDFEDYLDQNPGVIEEIRTQSKKSKKPNLHRVVEDIDNKIELEPDDGIGSIASFEKTLVKLMHNNKKTGISSLIRMASFIKRKHLSNKFFISKIAKAIKRKDLLDDRTIDELNNKELIAWYNMVKEYLGAEEDPAKIELLELMLKQIKAEINIRERKLQQKDY